MAKEALHAVEPMPTPANMCMIPHDYQSKAAAQALWSMNTDLAGFLLGSEMGTGKTLVAILVMWELRNEPGMSIVVAPAGLCQQWVDTIERAWETVSASNTNRRCRFRTIATIC